MSTINPADTAWMLIATAMVLVMTPALGFFYGGMVRAKNALNTMMMSYVAIGCVGLAWALIGYSLAFSEGSGLTGGLRFAFLSHVRLEPKGSIPHVLFVAYQGTFAVITAALISGAIVERMRCGPYLSFITLWSILVYAPIAHWVWGGGWLGKLGALDFAGGTVVHINAAAAAFVVAIVLGATSENARANEAQKLLNWGYTAYEAIKLFEANQAVVTPEVWKGTQKKNLILRNVNRFI